MEQSAGRIIGGAGQRQVQLPLDKAAKIAMQSIRVRFWRSMITAAGVFLGIAFLASTFAQAIIARHPDEKQLSVMAGMSGVNVQQLNHALQVIRERPVDAQELSR